jgi:2-dehydropantoate 2-reductase
LNIIVIGAGSVGLLFAAKMAAVCPRVDLIAHSHKQSEMITSQGILLVEENAERTVPIPCTAYPDAIRSGADWIFLTVKQRHIENELCEYIARMMTENTRIICFQNGIGHVENLAKYVPSSRIYNAVTTEGARKETDRAVRHTGSGTTWIGCSVKSKNSPACENLLAWLKNAGFACCLSNEIESIIWNKLLMNAVINPLTAIHGILNGGLLSSPFLLRVMRRLHEEGAAVARAEGIVTADDLWEQIITVCRKTASNHSSMLQDVMRGQKTEIAWINGSIVRDAERYRIQVPAHREILGIMKNLFP